MVATGHHTHAHLGLEVIRNTLPNLLIETHVLGMLHRVAVALMSLSSFSYFDFSSPQFNACPACPGKPEPDSDESLRMSSKVKQSTKSLRKRDVLVTLNLVLLLTPENVFAHPPSSILSTSKSVMIVEPVTVWASLTLLLCGYAWSFISRRKRDKVNVPQIDSDLFGDNRASLQEAFEQASSTLRYLADFGRTNARSMLKRTNHITCRKPTMAMLCFLQS